MKSITKHAGLNALATTLYITLVASFLFYVPQRILKDTEDTVFAPIAMLLLFVFSAAMTGLLTLGRPLMWYLDGKKKEAVSLLLTTLGFLFIMMFLAFALLVSFGS